MQKLIQLVVIHGGNFLSKGENMLTELRSQEVSIDDFKQDTMDGWKDKLPDDLGPDFELFYPEMPNWQNAHYEEWKIWFEKMLPFLYDDVILMGHSLGAIFLAKYLSENTFKKKIFALILLAAPYSEPKDIDHFASFTMQADLSRITSQVPNVLLYHSKDDSIVPFSALAKYQKKLPTAQVRVYKDRGHFIGRHFSEIVEDIKNLVKQK